MRTNNPQLKNSSNSGKGKWHDTAILQTLDTSKVPPHDNDLEIAILGACMLENGAFDRAAEILKPESFYHEAHRRVFEAMHRLMKAGSVIDLLTVKSSLEKSGDLELVGGPYAITKITNVVVSGAHIEQHAQRVQELYMKREIIRMCGEILSEASDETSDAFELLDKAEQHLFELSTGVVLNDPVSSGHLVVTVIKRIEQLMKQKDRITGVPTGFNDMDVITGGWQSGNLVIVAARPSVGKTAFALNLARNAASHPVKPTPVAFFSLEMGNDELMMRIISSQSRVALEKITRGILTMSEFDVVNKSGCDINDMPLYFDDTAGINIYSLRAKVRKLVYQHKVGLVIIDYLQLMNGVDEGRNTNREQEVSRISRALKQLAKEMKIPIIALSQMSRASENRKDGKFQLSDLRESGAIEQDADMVMFLARGDYGQSEEEKDQLRRQGMDINTSTQVQIRKHRNGKLEDINFQTDLSIQRWYDLDEWQSLYSVKQLPQSNFKRVNTADEEDDNPYAIF